MQTDLVIVSEYCQKCHIDPSFIVMLEEGGLIDINVMDDGEKYLLSSQLRDLEQYTRMYYDLSINIEGIEAIHHMLDRMRNLQDEISLLRTRLRLYEPFDFDTIENL
ncbi:chaperone modulator CbpM [Parabacteroides bouchesdurhonensis]|uniref:chaperone modulator CbpM n=1 Tax=Parabacteroides bouchesdurhonensis TaxID=1936995 RepID=UPI000C836BF3|nr:chaperone modulator CbpM [Parabacteroides bouchesdurhonensis]